MKVQSATSFLAAVALAAITGACAADGENRSALNSVTGPSALVQNHGVAEGCSPGFWKKKSWAGTGYTQGQTLESVFDVPDSLGIDNMTLLEALNEGGGGATALLRHGVAALLNAGHPSLAYPLDPYWTIQYVNGGLASGDADEIESRKNQLDLWNNTHKPGFCD